MAGRGAVGLAVAVTAVETEIGFASLAGEQLDGGDGGGQVVLDVSQEVAAEALALTVRSDDQPPEVGERFSEQDTDGGDEASVLADAPGSWIVAFELGLQNLKRFGQRR